MSVTLIWLKDVFFEKFNLCGLSLNDALELLADLWEGDVQNGRLVDINPLSDPRPRVDRRKQQME